MNYFLKFPFICSYSQLDMLATMRDGREDIRSFAFNKPWEKVTYSTVTGELQNHHLYMIVSRQRVRFSALPETGEHFKYDPISQTTPICINFQTRDQEQSVIDGKMSFLDSKLTDTLVHAKAKRIENLIKIEPTSGDEFPNAAAFTFNDNTSLKVRLSPDLWRFIELPIREHITADIVALDYRVEYIGKSINQAEVRLNAHSHIRKIAGMISHDEYERECFVIFYQVDFESKQSSGFGGRENELELCAAESILIQHFKPIFNEVSINFSLEGPNESLTDIGLAKRMCESGKYKPGGTTLQLTSLAAIEQNINLAWGRFYTAKIQGPLSDETQIVF